MKKLNIISYIVFALGLLGLLLGRVILPSDWVLRIGGVLLLVAIPLLVFSSVRLYMVPKQKKE